MLAHINLHWIDIANDINLMYIIPYSVKISMLMHPLPINPLWLSCLLSYTSISMIMMKLSSMLCKLQESSMSRLQRMSSLKSWSISALKNILKVVEVKPKLRNISSTRRLSIMWWKIAFMLKSTKCLWESPWILKIANYSADCIR